MSQFRDFSAQTSDVPKGLEHERALMAAVARAHYLEDRSRVEISDALGISRFKVARLLARAKEEGVVTIEIHDWGLPDVELSQRLQDKLGLENCLVVRSHGDDDDVRRQIGAAAARALSDTLHEDEVLGVTWGRTLTATASQFAHLPRLSIVQLTGVVAGDLASSPIEVVRQTSRRAGGAVYPIFSPLIVGDRETAASLRNHPDIRSAMDLFPSVTTALLSVGAWDPPVSQVRDVLPIDDLANALKKGCMADIAGILIGSDGTPVDEEFQDRCVNISYAELQRVPRVVAVAGGAAKADAIRTVSRVGLITELFTDHALAQAVLAEEA
ncbi:sugar-binding transcriptional regulator [Microbacterium sp. NPDC057658]